MQSGGSTPYFSGGIVMNACDKAHVYSNNIQSNYSNLTSNNMGIKVDVSTNSTLSCNYVHNQNYGIYFGGSCGGTDLKGNTMHNNFEGLHLNSNAEIGQQIHKGNEFIGNFDTTSTLNFNGAKNENNGFFGLQASRMDVHVIMGTQTGSNDFYFPKLPLLDFSTSTMVPGPYYSLGTSSSQTDWFRFQVGSPYECPDVLCPNDIDEEMVDTGDNEYERMIAQDSTETVDFVSESRSMAKQYLFEKLMENVSLLQIDSVFSEFANDNTSAGIGSLYEVKQMSTDAIVDSSYLTILSQLDSALAVKKDSITTMDSLILNSGLGGYELVKEELISSYSDLRSIYQGVDNTHNSIREIEFADAKASNATITSSEVPERNQKIVNEAIFSLEAYGLDSITGYTTSILEIALQCPYSGGKAVYQARWFVKEFINDTLQYDDAEMCLTQGFYRESGSFASIKNTPDLSFGIIPNPNKGIFEIQFYGDVDEVTTIEILNSYNQHIRQLQIEPKKNNYFVDLGKLTNGLYLVQVSTKSGKSVTKKLVLIN